MGGGERGGDCGRWLKTKRMRGEAGDEVDNDDDDDDEGRYGETTMMWEKVDEVDVVNE